MSVAIVFRNFARFRGRARRREFWVVLGSVTLGTLLLGPGVSLAGLGSGSAFLLGAWGIVTLLPLLSATARRFHDYELSGWWMILGIVPGIGLAFVLWVAALRGTDGPNRYGPEPLMGAAR